MDDPTRCHHCGKDMPRGARSIWCSVECARALEADWSDAEPWAIPEAPVAHASFALEPGDGTLRQGGRCRYCSAALPAGRANVCESTACAAELRREAEISGGWSVVSGFLLGGLIHIEDRKHAQPYRSICTGERISLECPRRIPEKPRVGWCRACVARAERAGW